MLTEDQKFAIRQFWGDYYEKLKDSIIFFKNSNEIKISIRIYFLASKHVLPRDLQICHR